MATRKLPAGTGEASKIPLIDFRAGIVWKPCWCMITIAVMMGFKDLRHLGDHSLLAQLVSEAGDGEGPRLGNPREAKPLEVASSRVFRPERVAVGEAVLGVGESGRGSKVGSDRGTSSGDRSGLFGGRWGRHTSVHLRLIQTLKM